MLYFMFLIVLRHLRGYVCHAFLLYEPRCFQPMDNTFTRCKDADWTPFWKNILNSLGSWVPRLSFLRFVYQQRKFQDHVYLQKRGMTSILVATIFSSKYLQSKSWMVKFCMDLRRLETNDNILHVQYKRLNYHSTETGKKRYRLENWFWAFFKPYGILSYWQNPWSILYLVKKYLLKHSGH